MTEDEQRLYDIYASWTGSLNFWVRKQLNRHVDVEFFPTSWEMAVYSGRAQDSVVMVLGFGTGATTPGLKRPEGERREVLQLPRPETQPSQDQLDDAFKSLCLAAARVLRIDLKRAQLTDSTHESDHTERQRLAAGEKEAGTLPALHNHRSGSAPGAQKTGSRPRRANKRKVDPEKPH